MCQRLLSWMQKEFGARSWELRNRPSMAKMLTTYQGMYKVYKESHYLQGYEELWTGIQQVYNNYPFDTLSRAYMHHAQIADAIIDFDLFWQFEICLPIPIQPHRIFPQQTKFNQNLPPY
jgi:hypothetical protein